VNELSAKGARLRVAAISRGGRVLAQLESGPALTGRGIPSRSLILAGLPGARYLADIGVRHQELILDDLAQCHHRPECGDRGPRHSPAQSAGTACPGVALHRFARHREARGPRTTGRNWSGSTKAR